MNGLPPQVLGRLLSDGAEAFNCNWPDVRRDNVQEAIRLIRQGRRYDDPEVRRLVNL